METIPYGLSVLSHECEKLRECGSQLNSIPYRNQSFDLRCKPNDWFLYGMQSWAEMVNCQKVTFLEILGTFSEILFLFFNSFSRVLINDGNDKRSQEKLEDMQCN